jgi:paraquat-inducible protein B
VALAALGVVIFGSGRFFAERDNFVLFFPGSVKGLTVGAPVTLEGVTIGTVTDVKVVFERETLKFFTPVYIEVFPDRVKDRGEYRPEYQEVMETDEAIKLLIDLGLRGQLELQSLLTGKLQVAVSMHPGSQVHYVGIEKDVPEIPTIPTTIQQLAKAFEKIDLQGIAEDISKAVAGIEQLATSPELAEAVISLNKTLKNVDKLAIDTRKLVNNVDGQVEPTFADLQKALNSADLALKQAKVTVASLDDVTGVDSALMWELNNTLLELQSMARQVNALVSLLQRQPDSIIRGKVSLGR